jgi:hypothetical protein
MIGRLEARFGTNGTTQRWWERRIGAATRPRHMRAMDSARDQSHPQMVTNRPSRVSGGAVLSRMKGREADGARRAWEGCNGVESRRHRRGEPEEILRQD